MTSLRRDGPPFRRRRPAEARCWRGGRPRPGSRVAFGTDALGSTPPHSDTWLTEEEQEVLVEVMSGFDGWVAGCLLEGLDEAPVRPPRGPRADYEAELDSGRRVRIVTVSDAPEHDSFGELLDEGYFCYVPV